MILESADPVTIRSSLLLPCRAHTLSWCASNVFTHSLVLMVQSFTRPSEPLQVRENSKKITNLFQCMQNIQQIQKMPVIFIYNPLATLIETSAHSHYYPISQSFGGKSCCYRATPSNNVHKKHQNGDLCDCSMVLESR